MEIKVTKKDALWSYLAQFFNVAAGFLTLPLILHMLTTEEIAMNYLLLTVGTIVALLDFGFAPQFGRTITYVFSGAQSLLKEGVAIEKDKTVNYQLLKIVLEVAKKVYLYMSILALVLMCSFGTLYIYRVTEGFTNVEHSFWVWIIYSISTFFTIYYKYYDSFLIGRGYIAESRKAMLASRICYILLSYILLLLGCGLIGVVTANLIAPFVSRFMSYRYFYDSKLKDRLSVESYSKSELKDAFYLIWYNTKKIGIGSLGAYAILKFSLFIAGLYLSMPEIAAFGLMTQLTGILYGMSSNIYVVLSVRLSSYRVLGDINSFKREFGFSLVVFMIVFLIGSLAILFAAPYLLTLIGAKAELPSMCILSLYLLINFLEGNHSLCASAVLTANKAPFVKLSIYTGVIICLLDYVSLEFTPLGLLGLVLVQGICQLACSNWYVPRWLCRDLSVNYLTLLRIGFVEVGRKMLAYGRPVSVA